MEKHILSVDIETYSSVDLGECGVYPYVEAPDFQILLFAYAFDDEPVQCIDLYHNPLPERLRVALTDPDIIKYAFNANFERTCLGKYLGKRMLPEQWRCTMVKALTLGLPGSLGKVALAMGLPEDKQKDKEGKALIRYFSIPCKPTKVNDGRKRNLPEHDPVKWENFIRYCLQDVEVERGIRKALSRHRTLRVEHEYWALDQDINDRGINLDMPLIEEAIHTDAEIKESAFAELKRLTGVENPNSRAQIKEWVEKQIGQKLEKFDKEILANLIEELPDGTVKRVIYLRQLTTKTSVKKYEKMKMYQCSDGRARGTMQFYGASRTGRFAGRGIQLQNLAKNHMEDLGDARYLVRSGDTALLSLCYDNIPDVLSQLVKTALIPSDGCRFIVSDFSSIEARVIAWLAGEQWRLKVFEDGGDIYCASASQMFGVPVEKHGINGELRQKGKVAELACIAEGTLITTDQGPVPIEYVTTDMKLWDGVEYVSHKGVIYKGKKEVITYEGLTATPDHLVWVEGERGPIHFGEAARSGKRIYKPRSSGKSIWKCRNNKPGKALQKRLAPMLCTNKVQALWKNTLDKFIQSYKRNFKGMPTLFTATCGPKVAIQKTDSRKTEVRKYKGPGISKLWRSWHKILFLQCQRCLQMDYGEFGLQPGKRTGSYRQQRKLRAWKPPVCNQKTESGESKDNRFAGMEPRRVAVCPQHSEPFTCTRNEPIRNTRFRTSGSDREEKKLERNSKEVRVYDIVMCGPRNRYVANGCLVHNCGYGGGVGSLKAFGADKMGLSEDEMQKIITDWRLASPRITKLWWDVDRAAKKAVSNGKVINLQYGLRFAYFDNRLFIQLPSKRSLAYMNPRILPNRRFGKDGLVYDGIQQQSHNWGQIDTYGPKLVENIVQAIARDCLLIAMKRLDNAGFKAVSHVHDEVILDVPKGTGSVEEVGEIMGEPIDWAPGLLLRADGYECDYYMKD